MTLSPRDYLHGHRTYRRYLLDFLLEENIGALSGVVLDVGGEPEGARGNFRYRLNSSIDKLYFLNISTENSPTLVGDAHYLPFRSECLDGVVCCEVLEHVTDPSTCCAEIYRTLKPGGILLLSVPFLFPIHADPYDFQRYTMDGIRNLCHEFDTVDIIPMGGTLGTLGLLIDLSAKAIHEQSLLHKAQRAFLHWFGRRLTTLELRFYRPNPGRFPIMTTGYFCIAHKGMR